MERMMTTLLRHLAHTIKNGNNERKKVAKKRQMMGNHKQSAK